jgi:flagellar biosynthesis/type III secretory pathway M-ring protein FliF/YscJ
MKEEDHNQKDNQQRSQDLSKEPQKKAQKKVSYLNRLIFIVCCAIIAFVGINFIACNFMLPGSMNQANAKGELKNPPPLDCKESERRGYDVLVTILTTVIALKTKMEED